MHAGLFWTLVLATVAVAVLLAVGRRLRAGHRTETDDEEGADPACRTTMERIRVVRDGLVATRPVNLRTWPDVLAAQALRAARPIPGGRALPPGYRLRCGEGLFAAALPHENAIVAATLDLVRQGAGHPAAPRPRLRLVFDVTLGSEAWRLDPEIPLDSPRRAPSRTTFFHEPLSAPTTTPGRTVESSGWLLVDATGRAHAVPPSGVITVGTDPTCGVVVDDPFVSAHHLRISVVDDHLFLRDGTVGPGPGAVVVPSTNGTFLRDHAVCAATLEPSEVAAGTVALRLGPHLHLAVDHEVSGATRPYPSELSTARTRP